MSNAPPPPFFVGMTEALMNRKLTGTDIRVLCALCSFYNRKTGACWPSKRSIQERSGMGRTMVSDSLRHLRDSGYINYWKSPTKAGNEYEILYPEVEYEGVGPPDTPLPDIPTPPGQDVRHGDVGRADSPPVTTSDPKQRTELRSELTKELINKHSRKRAFAQDERTTEQKEAFYLEQIAREEAKAAADA